MNSKYSLDVITGLRPTANLTLANYLGAVKPFLELQEKYSNSMIFVADMHGLTDSEPQKVLDNTREIVADYLALGLDPKKVSIFIQSAISTEVLELTMYLLRHITVAELLRVPTLKDKLKSSQNPENANTLLAIYPVLMAADILIQKTQLVPVGEDQIPHLEVTRVLARRFNEKYGEVFGIPEKEELKSIKILGLKGEGKMSKSVPENAIFLTDSPEEVLAKIKVAETANPGEMTPALESHFLIIEKLSRDPKDLETLNNIRNRHLNGEKVMAEFKAFFAKIVIKFLSEFQKKRQEIVENKSYINSILEEGNLKAKLNAQKTLTEVRQALFSSRNDL